MLIAILKYTMPLSEINALLLKHREYLQTLSNQHKLVSGKLQPRTGDITIAKNITQVEFEKILKANPFVKVSEYQIIEFFSTLYNDCLKEIIEADK